jgi:putative sigma-54 modulation protein
MIKINFQVRNIELKDITKEYIIEKLQKLEKLIPDYENLTVTIDKISNSKSKYNLNQIDITLKMPHAYIKVENKGVNINTVIDKLLAPLLKKITRYKSQEERWTKHKNWKVIQIEKTYASEDNSENEDIQVNYEPLIKRKFYLDDSPIHPVEAIEKMELLGHQQFLFRNIENNKYAIIVKDINIGYQLIQPK